MTTLQEIMTENVVEVKPSDNLFTLAREMEANDIGFLPVIDDKFLGVVTDRDIVCKGLAKGQDINNIEAQQIMTEKVYTGFPDMDVEEASKLMQVQQISRLLVVENDQLKGVVSLGDIAATNNEQAAESALSEIKKSTP
ncbi:CBS domain-containing protein [Oceanobacillus chungangensis]|uniref:CBS domain-containing protein n=1 Tax=Oceanobacillus chungangensis TaxID=1229152 RepID=A0A3D8PN66_9BACI|nr:CBS domain-containing protein [Oceanobacillus chungangensis]RDW16688.1 CBS domain-containing protein [Oceanobacillus chungangensis]